MFYFSISDHEMVPERFVSFKCRPMHVQPRMKRQKKIPWARFMQGWSVVCILPSCVVLRLTFCVIITVSRSKGTTVFCKLELHVLRQENLA